MAASSIGTLSALPAAMRMGRYMSWSNPATVCRTRAQVPAASGGLEPPLVVVEASRRRIPHAAFVQDEVGARHAFGPSRAQQFVRREHGGKHSHAEHVVGVKGSLRVAIAVAMLGIFARRTCVFVYAWRAAGNHEVANATTVS
jgi:hypothetical protein